MREGTKLKKASEGIIVRVMTNGSIYLEVLWVFVCLEPSAMRAGRVYQQLYEHVVPGFHRLDSKSWQIHSGELCTSRENRLIR
jgi:hypothetical protein